MNRTVTIEIIDAAAIRFLRELAAISLIRLTSENQFEDEPEHVNDSVFGRLNAYANPSLYSKENTAWEEAVAEKAEKYAVH